MACDSGIGQTFRARQIQTVGANTGKFMAEDLLDLTLEGLSSLYAAYEEDLGNGVRREIRQVDSDEESITVESKFTRWREPERRFKVKIVIEEQQV
jgi:hypothetical protein